MSANLNIWHHNINIWHYFSPKGPKDRAYKTGINFMVFILVFVEKCLYYDTLKDFSVLMRNGSNPTDINRLEALQQSNFLQCLTTTKACFHFLPTKLFRSNVVTYKLHFIKVLLSNNCNNFTAYLFHVLGLFV